MRRGAVPVCGPGGVGERWFTASRLFLFFNARRLKVYWHQLSAADLQDATLALAVC